MSGFADGTMGHVASLHFLIFLANAACASTLACGAGLLAAWLLRRQSASLQHAVLLWSIVVATISPAILLAGMTANFGWLTAPRAMDESPITMATPGSENPPGVGGAALDRQVDQTFADARPAGTGGGWGSPWTGLWPGVWSRLALASIWGVGDLVQGGLFLFGWVMVRRLRRSLQPCTDERVTRLATDVFASLEMPAVPIAESPDATIPFCLGFFRPAIVLPYDLAEVLEPQQLRLVLLHEIAHLRQRDHWVALVQVVGEILFWWNPLLRALNRSLDCLREQVCDDFVVDQAKQERPYAEVLVQMAEWHAMIALPQLFVSALFGHGAKDLERRIRRILDHGSVRGVSASHRAAGFAAVLGLCISAPLFVPILRASDATILPVVLAGATGDASRSTPADATAILPGVQAERIVDLSGNWLLHLPAGFDHQVEMIRIDEWHYRFSRRLTMSGIYELQDNRLVMQKPVDPRLTEFQWKLRPDGSLVLVDQPPAGKTGATYLGAAMKRAD
jgi:beta-lactamase regulating signal transducer with metallopeptidase domain